MNTPDTPDTPAAERWMARFPEATRPTIASWFAYAVTTGAKTPDVCLAVVTRVVGARRDWATTAATKQLCDNTLTALRCDREGALAYAASVL
jgi:hypothetical protein